MERATQRIHRMIDEAIDKMRPSEAPVPVILVGGGAILLSVSWQLHPASSCQTMRASPPSVRPSYGWR